MEKKYANSQEKDGNVGHRVDEADDPAVPRALALARHRAARRARVVGDAQGVVKRQVGAV